ncbi:uncharacterized protein LOC132226566 [Myotis daubentonii]|uniref:uncharacterized protein LOC132226566 n=1 Tax=Myotis daubentonii TaxID=98922 RepID=UPI002872C66C|nr:uncharacterized protein LOC132226566 [Myotis daubentonii]
MSQYSWTTRRTVDLGTGQVSHSFMVIPECPYPLLGRDLLTKIGAQITFRQGGPQVTDEEGRPIQVLTMRLEDEYRLYQKTSLVEGSMDKWLQEFPTAWAETGGVGLAAHRAPVLVELKPGEGPVRIKQYPMPQEARKGIQPHIRRLKSLGVLVPCQSAWNTPLLPVKKPQTNDYRPVQDLREVNKRVMDIHPTVPNPYTLLSSLAPSKVWYTVLDLKDAFFSLPLAPQSQSLFAFEWHDPEEGFSGQLTWTRLPQGFKNSPTIFDEALHEDLGEYRREHPNLTLLQYVDDILIAADTAKDCERGTQDLLATLGALGYRASARKAQLCRERVSYLGYILEGGQRRLSDARKETVLKIPTPTSRREVREFLGSAGYCRLWIPGFAEIARPLYEATKEGKAFDWTEKDEVAFRQLKKALLGAPALGLPDITKPFHLFVDEHKGIAKGVLTQALGPWSRPVAYLSKKLDPVAAGWPPCLRIIAATALLVKDADKLTLGQEIWITTPHAIEGVLKQPPDRWMSNARITHYQSLLLNPPRVRFHPSAALNPATLLPDPDLDAPLHDCAGILEQVHGLRKDLTDQPLPDAEATWFTDGSSFVRDGCRYAGAAVVTETDTVWAEALPSGTSAQRAELIALTKALTLGAGKRLNVYTDSRYAFATAHVHGAIYQERGLLTAEGRTIKNKQEILDLLAALWLPAKLAIIHCQGHQKADDPVARGNQKADQAAKAVALTSVPTMALQLPDPGDPVLPDQPKYSQEELQRIRKLPRAHEIKGWWHTPEGELILPDRLGDTVLEHMHRSTHLGTRKMKDLIRHAGIKIHQQDTKIDQVVSACKTCQLTNTRAGSNERGTRLRGTKPGAQWEVDFTEIKPGKYGYKYLLVFVDTFSGWVEAYPTKHETAQTVAKKLLEDILPRYGFPAMIGSDNGPAFISQVTQVVTRATGANWKLHCAYRPQSSGQVERMNRTLKETLTKLTMETGGDWVALLPYALYRVRNSPYTLGFTPYEIMFGRPPPIIPNLKADLLAEFENQELSLSLRGLQKAHEDIWPRLRAIYEASPTPTPHQHRPGDWVYVRRHRRETLEPRWKGPYTVVLTTPTALKVDGVATWVHHTHVRSADPSMTRKDFITKWSIDRDQCNPLKLKLRRARPA